MENKNERKAAKDLGFGVFLVLFGIYIIVSSSQMKFLKTFTDGAGFFPMIIGIVLTGLGAVLAFIGVRTGGAAELKEVLSGTFLKAFVTNERFLRVIILLAMMVVYVFVLLELLGFLIASPIYLFATFLYLQACERKGPIPGWVISLVISVLTTVVVYYSFKLGLGVILP